MEANEILRNRPYIDASLTHSTALTHSIWKVNRQDRSLEIVRLSVVRVTRVVRVNNIFEETLCIEDLVKDSLRVDNLSSSTPPIFATPDFRRISLLHFLDRRCLVE